MATVAVAAVLDQEQSSALAGRICAAAGLSAQWECELLDLI